MGPVTGHRTSNLLSLLEDRPSRKGSKNRRRKSLIITQLLLAIYKYHAALLPFHLSSKYSDNSRIWTPIQPSAERDRNSKYSPLFL